MAVATRATLWRAAALALARRGSRPPLSVRTMIRASYLPSGAHWPWPKVYSRAGPNRWCEESSGLLAVPRNDLTKADGL